MQFAQRDMGPADVGRSRVGQQTGLEHHRGEPQRTLARDRVEGGDPDQVPQGLDGTRRLAVGGQPAAEVLGVQGRIGEVETLERERGTPDGGALGEREVRIGGQAAPQMQGHGQRVAPQSAEPPALGLGEVHDGHVQAVLQRCQRRALDPVEEPAVGGAATQVHMLAVVDGQFAALEGEGEAAQPGPAFEEGDADARVGEGERRGDAGEAAADHDGAACRALGGALSRCGACAVAHGASFRACRPCWLNGARTVVAVRDATPWRGVARRKSPGSVRSIRRASRRTARRHDG